MIFGSVTKYYWSREFYFTILSISILMSFALTNMEIAWGQSVVDSVSVGDAPYALVYNPSNENIYVTNRDSDDVSVIDSSTNTVIATGDVGRIPYYLEYNPSNEGVYVGNYGSDDVSVIDSSTNTVIATGDVGLSPNDLEYNPTNENIYVANIYSDNLSIISDLIKPIADAGPNQTVVTGTTVILDGGGSFDPTNQTLTYQWTQTEGPAVALNHPTSVNPTCTAPLVESQQNIVFELVVTNENGIESEPNSVRITINPSDNPQSTPAVNGILDSGNNINIHVQENSGNNVGEQSGREQIYYDSPVIQGRSTKQDSHVVS